MDTSEFWLLETLQQINYNSLVIKPKQKQVNKEKFIYEDRASKFLSFVRLSFLIHIMNIKIGWIYPCLTTLPTLPYLTN